MRRATALALAAALLLPGCRTAGEGTPREVVETVFLDRLEAAIDDVNATRARLAQDANAISTAAAAIDAVDDVAITGDREATRPKRAAASRVMPPAMSAARRLNKDVRAYRDAITRLDKVPGTGLDAVQRGAIDDVVRAVRAELVQLRGYATVVASVWPRYETLHENQGLWLMRASNGWYRDTQESAGAYAVLSGSRAQLAQDRKSLAGADTKRLAAARAAGDAIDAARGALASLSG